MLSKMSYFQFSLCAGEQHIYIALVVRIFFFKHMRPLKETFAGELSVLEDGSRGSRLKLGRGPGVQGSLGAPVSLLNLILVHRGRLHGVPGDCWS